MKLEQYNKAREITGSIDKLRRHRKSFADLNHAFDLDVARDLKSIVGEENFNTIRTLVLSMMDARIQALESEFESI
ncbi:MAG: hypothetical protein ACK4S4_15550 [Pyrinomonadaceae bacterium]